MGRPKNADGQRTRQAILDAALDLFADRGYFGTSLRDVATAVGVRESALYNYFRSKEALFDALLTAHQHGRLERLATLEEAELDGAAQLEEFVVATLDASIEPHEEKFFRILMSDGMRLARDGRHNLYERMSCGREWVHDVLRRMIRRGELRRADVTLLGMAFLSPLMMWRQLHAIDADLPADRDRREFARLHVQQFLHGAAPRPAARRVARRAAAARPATRPRLHA